MEERIKEIKVATFDGEVKESDIVWLIEQVEITKTLKMEVEYSKELNEIMKEEIKNVNKEMVRRTQELNKGMEELHNENIHLKIEKNNAGILKGD